jgi:hypothetical protein
MGAPSNPGIDLQVSRGSGLHLVINARPVDRDYGAILMAELAVLCPFPDVRVDVDYRCRQRPTPADMARMIATELGRNEIWD